MENGVEYVLLPGTEYGVEYVSSPGTEYGVESVSSAVWSVGRLCAHT